jgi:hypothetical protein
MPRRLIGRSRSTSCAPTRAPSMSSGRSAKRTASVASTTTAKAIATFVADE